MHWTDYLIAAGLSVVLTAAFTVLVRRVAVQRCVVDRPEADPTRKIHRQPMPLLGGLAIYLGYVIVTLIFTYIAPRLLGGYLLPKHLFGLWLGGLVVVVGGAWDDAKRLSPGRQILFPIIASLIVVASGIGIQYISNPFGNAIQLDQWRWTLFTWHGLPYSITLLADLFTFVWLMGMMYTTKFLDGLDGLATGITTIGAVAIFILSVGRTVAQPETALLAAIFAGAGVGFLIFNWHPAKIFLGEGGSVLIGFLLGTLSIISGAKIAMALLVMGIPILDVIWIIIRRGIVERRSILTSDRKHLHFRLLDLGLSQRQVVVLLYVLTGAFGLIGLLLSGREKVWSLAILGGIMIVLGVIVVKLYNRRQVTRKK
ncbi:MAG: MraY family glycosyltransferase [Patescibacteria group bacterium]|jgi:UDP-GlcNAc:undecaprenyl-phosphate GlcNAc-1-phosphate transferase